MLNAILLLCALTIASRQHLESRKDQAEVYPGVKKGHLAWRGRRGRGRNQKIGPQC